MQKYLLCALFTFAAFADETALKVIRLNYRQASTLLPTLQSMYGDKARISAIDTRLLVKASPATISEITRLASQLDTPARMLRIAIKNAGQAQSAGQQLSVSGNTAHGVINRAQVQINENAGQQQTASERYVLVEEGTPAIIEGAGGGTQVIARLQGENGVSIQLVNAENSYNKASAATTRNGRLGEWLEVGSVQQSAERKTSGILATESQAHQGTSSLTLKVDLAR